jgi:hypothetical protein
MDSAAIDMDVQVSLLYPALNFSGICPGVTLLDFIVVLLLVF